MKLRFGLSRVGRGLGLVVIGALVAGTVAFLLSLAVPRSYVSEARLIVHGSDPGLSALRREAGANSVRPERDMATEAELVQRAAIARAAIRRAHLNLSVNEVLDAIEVAPVTQTNILAVRAHSGTPEEAARIANAVATAYVDTSATEERATVARAADQVEARLKVLAASINRARSAGARSASDLGVEGPNQSVDRYAALSAQLDQMRISQAAVAGQVQVSSRALPDPDGFTPNPRGVGILGVLAGLLVGAAAWAAISSGERGPEEAIRAESPE